GSLPLARNKYCAGLRNCHAIAAVGCPVWEWVSIFRDCEESLPELFQPQPASIQYSWPVHRLASSEAKNNTSAATWRGKIRVFRHCCATSSASPSAVYHLLWRAVFTLPGTTAVTRILSGPSSRASARVMPSIPAFAVS